MTVRMSHRKRFAFVRTEKATHILKRGDVYLAFGIVVVEYNPVLLKGKVHDRLIP